MADEFDQYKATPQSGDEWDQYKVKPAAPAPQTDWRDTVIRSMDPDLSGSHPIKNFLLGAGQGIANVALHPVASMMAGAPTSGGNGYPGLSLTGNRATDEANANMMSERAQKAREEAGQMNEAFHKSPAHFIGSVAGPLAATYGLGKVAPLIAEPLGETMKGTAGKIIDRTAGVLKSDVAHGAQPGRAYLEGGGTPALTMRGLANKAEAINENTGAKLGQAYRDAGNVRIPADRVLDEVSEPISRLRTLKESPGGTGAGADIDAYENRLIPPISAAAERGGFTPRELFEEMKRPIAANTRWNDPTMFDLNNVRQQTTGRIGGLLTEAVPETGPLNKIYQGTGNLAGRAGARADTGQIPLTAIARRGAETVIGAGLGYGLHHPLLSAVPLLADTVPARTALSYGLFHGGRAAPLIGSAASVASPLGIPATIGGRVKRVNEVNPDEENQK